MRQRHDRVNSSESCRGRGGVYEVWMHVLPPGTGPAVPRQIEIAGIAGDCGDIDERLALPDKPGLADVVRLLQRFDIRWGRRAINPDRIATASLIRVCNRATHAGGPQRSTGKDRGWLEAVTRAVQLVPGKGELPRLVPESPIRVGVSGIGEWIPPADISESGLTVVSVPTTLLEANSSGQVVMPVAFRPNPAEAAYAVVHMQDGAGGSLERVYRPAA